LVLQSLHDADFGDVARGAGLDDAGLLGEGIDALAGLASLTALGHELADAVEAETLALFHLVVDEFKETFVDLLAHLSLDTGHVLEGLGDLGLGHLLTLGGDGLLATVMNTGGLLDGFDWLGGLDLSGLLLLGRTLLGLASLALGTALLGGTLLHHHFEIVFCYEQLTPNGEIIDPDWI